MAGLISYRKKNTPIHRLSGFTKLVFFLMWCLLSALTYDTRILAVMILCGALIVIVSRTEMKQVAPVLKAVSFFMVINLICIFLFAPFQGTLIYGTRTDLFHIAGKYTVTREQLFYELNVLMKYFTVVPAVLIFLVTTDPSELSASMNMAGVPYSIAYSLAIALRYIPDVQNDFHRIKKAQEARGIEMSSKEKLLTRLKRVATIITPLLFSSMDRIEVVSNAMELRGFGKKKKRTWYAYRKLKAADHAVLAGVIIFFVIAMIITFADGSRFYNPWG